MGDYSGVLSSCQIRDKGVTEREQRGWEGKGMEKRKKPGFQEKTRFLVEMAGIEPASEKFDLQMSTSLVDLLVWRSGAPVNWVSRPLSDCPREGVSSRAYRS